MALRSVALGAVFVAIMLAAVLVAGVLHADSYRGHIIEVQKTACLELLGETCAVGFKAQSLENRAYTACVSGLESRPVVVYWNPRHMSSADVEATAYHEAFHQFFWRECGCGYADARGSRKYPHRGTTEGDAELAARRYLRSGEMPDWGCP